jgi:hypothetical protein
MPVEHLPDHVFVQRVDPGRDELGRLRVEADGHGEDERDAQQVDLVVLADGVEEPLRSVFRPK